MDKIVEQFEFLSLSETAATLSVSKKTLDRMIKQGKLPAFKVGGQWRIRASRLKKWVEEMEAASKNLPE